MSLVCNCPLPTAISITTESCLEDLGVPVRLLFHRTKSAAGAVQAFDADDDAGTDVDDPTTVTFWDALTGASDNSKVISTPIIHNVEFSGGEVRQYGGGNTTYGGIPINRGSEFTNVTGEFLRLKQSIVQDLKDLMCEDGNLSAFFVHEGGQISGVVDSLSSPTTFRGFPVYSWFVGDKMLGQRDGIDKNMFQFSLLEDWSNYFYHFVPVFDAITYDFV